MQGLFCVPDCNDFEKRRSDASKETTTHEQFSAAINRRFLNTAERSRTKALGFCDCHKRHKTVVGVNQKKRTESIWNTLPIAGKRKN